MAKGYRRKLGQVDLEDREVGFRITADHPGQGLAAILERHDDLLGIGCNVIVGQQVALGAHDDCRAEARLHAPLPWQVVVEKALEQRVFGQRRLLLRLLDDLGGIEIGNGWCRRSYRIGIRIGALLGAGGY